MTPASSGITIWLRNSEALIRSAAPVTPTGAGGVTSGPCSHSVPNVLRSARTHPSETTLITNQRAGGQVSSDAGVFNGALMTQHLRLPNERDFTGGPGRPAEADVSDQEQVAPGR